MAVSALKSWVAEAGIRRAAEAFPTLDCVLNSDNKLAQLLSSLEDEEKTSELRPLYEQIGRLLAQGEWRPSDFERILDRLPADGSSDRYFSSLVFRHDIPESILLRLINQGRLINAIGHRSGPTAVLQACLNHSESEDAVCGLFSAQYALPDCPLEAAVAFVQKYASERLKQHIAASENLNAERRDMLLRVLQEPATP